MIGRLVRSADFERVLRTRSRATSLHFAVHHVAGLPTQPSFSRPVAEVPSSPPTELFTGNAPNLDFPVDDLVSTDSLAPKGSTPGVWYGAVVPKRHARRAVTRTLLKRQIRTVASVVLGGTTVARGLWVVRLRAPFDRAAFPSAASDALRLHARAELQQVFALAAERLNAR